MAVSKMSPDNSEGRYQPLVDDIHIVNVQSSSETLSLPRRLIVVTSAIVACLVNAGLVFGYSAIYPALIHHGVFRDECLGVAPGHLCTPQELKLAGMFTLATSSLNLISLPAGAALDRLGPKRMGVSMIVLVVIGCWFFANGGSGLWELGYFCGFLFMAVSGPPVFMSVVSFANLFPRHAGLVTAALVGCFDASSAVFVVLAAIIEGGVPFGVSFISFSFVPMLCAFSAAAFWPWQPVAGADADKGPLQEQGLHGLSAREQIATREFWLLTYSLSMYMLCINYFIATVDQQMLHYDPINAPDLQKAFAILLPLGGIVYIPFVGAITDRMRLPRAWLTLWLAMILFAGLRTWHEVSKSAVLGIASFVVFAFCRPLLYTLGAASTGQLFGFANFGTVYGLAFTVAGAVNCLVQPMRVIAEDYGFSVAHVLLVFAQVSTIIMPIIFELSHQTVAPDPIYSFSPRSRGMSTPGR